MAGGRIMLGILFLIGAIYFVANWYHPQQTKKEIGFEAKLVSESLYEQFEWQTYTEFKRLIYEYPRDQVPEEAAYFYVNITIPDTIANQLDQLAAQYSNLKDAFYPRVYAAKISGTNQFSYYRPFAVLYVERTPNGIPKKIQVKFKTTDVPNDADLLIVSFHIPFFEDWDDNTPFCFENQYDIDPEGQWTAIKLEKQICITSRYDRNTYTSWRILNDQVGYEGWTVLMRELNMPIDPYKPLYTKWAVDYYETGNWYHGGGLFTIGLEFELNDTSTYFVAFRAWYDQPYNYLANYRTAFNNVHTIDCAFVVDKNNALIDIASYIQQYCNIDWNKVRKLKKVYIALRDERAYNTDSGPYVEGHTILSYLFIGHQDFIASR